MTLWQQFISELARSWAWLESVFGIRAAPAPPASLNQGAATPLSVPFAPPAQAFTFSPATLPAPVAAKLSPAGFDFLTSLEGLRLAVYPDSAGNPTIGYGHKLRLGDGLSSASVITPDQARALLLGDVVTAEAAVRRAVKVPISQNQFDAMVSLAYNIGAGNFAASTVVAKLNAGDVAGAMAGFSLWKYSDGRPVLAERRSREAALFATA